MHGTPPIGQVSEDLTHYVSSILPILKQEVHDFKAGKLKQFSKNWRYYTKDKNILQMVQGCSIEFDYRPKQNLIPKPIKFSLAENAILDSEIAKLLTKGVIVPSKIYKNDYVSNVFLRRKKDGNYRLILNLKAMNKSVTYRHFKMDNLKTAIDLVRPNCFMASVDLKDAYYSVPIHNTYQSYLKFKFDNKVYAFTCLPNGLSPAPQIFTKILKPVSVLTPQT